MESFSNRKKNMNILVTGGLGHIGSKLIRSLIADRDKNIVIVDSLLTLKEISIFGLELHQIKFYAESIETFVQNSIHNHSYDLVIHLAARTFPSESNKEVLYENNYTNTVSLVNYCLENQVPIIFPSSCSVYYGTGGNVNEESHIKKGISRYSDQKIMEEKFIIEAGNLGLKYLILRLGTIHGVSSGIRFHTAVNKFCFDAVLNKQIEVWSGALSSYKPYLALEDFASMIKFAIHLEFYPNKIFNLVTNTYSVLQIKEFIEESIGYKIRVKTLPTNLGSDKSLHVSTNEIQKHGFTFQGSIRKDIEETINLLRRQIV